jgi:hypothetical protein
MRRFILFKLVKTKIRSGSVDLSSRSSFVEVYPVTVRVKYVLVDANSSGGQDTSIASHRAAHSPSTVAWKL